MGAFAAVAQLTGINIIFYYAPLIFEQSHTGGSHGRTRYTGGHVVHTGQFFFPEATSTRVYRTSPYTSDPNTRTRNADDHVYTGQHGASSVLRISGSVATGLRGAITLAVDA